MKLLPASIGFGGVAATAIAWGGYLHRRRIRWNHILDKAKPVHAKWWRDYHHRKGELLYVALGDSTAQGIGASKPWRSYVGELARHISKTTGKSVRVVNLSVTATTVFETYRDQLPVLRNLEPDIVTVSVGANNMFDFDAQRFEKDLRRLYEGLPPHSIVSDLPSFLVLPAERNVIAANKIVHALAEEFGFSVAPLYSRTHRQGLWAIITQMSGDLFHPNDRGYRVWASAFVPLLDTLLQRSESPTKPETEDAATA